MKSILIIGMTGTGKSFETKKILKKFPKLDKYIFDVNNEYGVENLPTLEEFLNTVVKVENSVIVFEEATVFFSTRGRSEQVVNLLVRKRHTKNIIIFIFHSIRAVPSYIYELCDYVYIKKTNDTVKRIKSTHDSEKLIEIFEDVKINSNLEPYYTVKVRGTDL